MIRLSGGSPDKGIVGKSLAARGFCVFGRIPFPPVYRGVMGLCPRVDLHCPALLNPGKAPPKRP